jgi:hypothetical protein
MKSYDRMKCGALSREYSFNKCLTKYWIIIILQNRSAANSVRPYEYVRGADVSYM